MCLEVTWVCLDVTWECLEVTWVCLDVTWGYLDVTSECLEGCTMNGNFIYNSLQSWMLHWKRLCRCFTDCLPMITTPSPFHNSFVPLKFWDLSGTSLVKWTYLSVRVGGFNIFCKHVLLWLVFTFFMLLVIDIYVSMNVGTARQLKNDYIWIFKLYLLTYKPPHFHHIQGFRLHSFEA